MTAVVKESGVSAQIRRVVPDGDVQSLVSSAEVSRSQAVHGIIKQHECSGEKSLSTNKSRISSLSPMRSHGRGKREIPEKTRRLAVSSGTIPTCESPEWFGRGLNPVRLGGRRAV
ncbi:hypothetical protein PR048_017730 [Dryococelus australis]|uniref:Uncharacterized protein n=1 Tax=Dryococelus australis TaxID=614101 RepID=A0ABQ9HAF2_9NEOP|nr:hypothetical protein PR048_017730 [Dryococelus australis]